MTSHAEDVLLVSLVDTDALEALAQIGLPEDAIPTLELRPVVSWALEMFFESGRTRAPTLEALQETWGTHLEDASIEMLDDQEDTDTVQWAINQLKAQYVHSGFQDFIRSAATEMATASVPDKVDVLGQQADLLFELSTSVQPRHMQAEGAEAFDQALARYEAREREGHVTRGLTFGLPLVDQHLYGIHDGEVGVISAGPKVGKSFFIDFAAKECWITGGQDTTIFTLENSVEMTIDRIICLELQIDSRRWQRGLCDEAEVERVRQFKNEVIPALPGRLRVIMPEPGHRTMSAMVRQAQILGTRRLFIDQLTFVEHPNADRKSKPQVIGEMMHDLKTAVATGGQPLPVLLAHQINREGVKSAKKTGFHQMTDMAEGSEVERTADHVLSLYQSNDDRIAGEALLQVLATRRETLNAWRLVWQPAGGMVAAIREEVLDL